MYKIAKLPSRVKHLYLDIIGDEKVNVYESRNHVYIYYVLDCGVFRISKKDLKVLSGKMISAYEKFGTSDSKE